MEINFMLPDFLTGDKCYSLLLSLYKERPEIFRNGRKIGALYGSFPGMIWNGGSGFGEYHIYSMERVAATFKKWNEQGVQIVLTCTNPVLKKYHLFDTYCNNILSELNKTKGNAVLVSTDLMEKHIRENFLNVDIYKSIIGTEEKNYYKSYNRSVLARRCNTNLDKIPIEDRDKLEILCNDPCPDNCPNIYEHYNAYGRMMLRQNFSDKKYQCIYGDKRSKFKWEELRTIAKNTFISPDKVDDLAQLGYKWFKISGRWSPSAIIVFSIEYLIKPEFVPDIMMLVINEYVERNII